MTEGHRMTEAEALKEATHQHYRGGLYKVIGTALHTETQESVVVYEHLYPHERALYVRPADMFYGKLEDGRLRFAPLMPLMAETTPVQQGSYIGSVTDASFATDVLGDPGITVVDFAADWCGPCKMMMPSLEKVAEKFQGRVKVVKMNVDDNTVIPNHYGVRGIPNMIFFANGNQVLNSVGAKTLAQVTALFEKVIEQHAPAVQ
jgi:thioredoxin